MKNELIINNDNNDELLMYTDKRYRRYMLTINNPETDWSHNNIKSSLSQLRLKYWCMADEISNSGTYHTHVYLVAETSAIAFSRIKSLFPTAHIESAYSTSTQCRDYVKKSGQWENSEKAETSVKNTFEEWGDMPYENQGQRNDWKNAQQMIEDGNTILSIVQSSPHMMKYMNTLKYYQQEFIYEYYKDIFRHVDVTYIYGTTGVGKTKYVAQTHGYSNICNISTYTDKPFDEYTIQPILLFDEFASQISIQLMNIYLDGHPVKLPARYHNKSACYTKVYIISNIRLEDQYKYIQNNQSEVWDAFLRRINNVMIFTGNDEYKIYETKEYMEMVNDNYA